MFTCSEDNYVTSLATLNDIAPQGCADSHQIDLNKRSPRSWTPNTCKHTISVQLSLSICQYSASNKQPTVASQKNPSPKMTYEYFCLYCSLVFCCVPLYESCNSDTATIIIHFHAVSGACGTTTTATSLLLFPHGDRIHKPVIWRRMLAQICPPQL